MKQGRCTEKAAKKHKLSVKKCINRKKSTVEYSWKHLSFTKKLEGKKLTVNTLPVLLPLDNIPYANMNDNYM